MNKLGLTQYVSQKEFYKYKNYLINQQKMMKPYFINTQIKKLNTTTTINPSIPQLYYTGPQIC